MIALLALDTAFAQHCAVVELTSSDEAADAAFAFATALESELAGVCATTASLPASWVACDGDRACLDTHRHTYEADVLVDGSATEVGGEAFVALRVVSGHGLRTWSTSAPPDTLPSAAVDAVRALRDAGVFAEVLDDDVLDDLDLDRTRRPEARERRGSAAVVRTLGGVASWQLLAGEGALHLSLHLTPLVTLDLEGGSWVGAKRRITSTEVDGYVLVPGAVGLGLDPRVAGPVKPRVQVAGVGVLYDDVPLAVAVGARGLLGLDLMASDHVGLAVEGLLGSLSAPGIDAEIDPSFRANRLLAGARAGLTIRLGGGS